ncbi:hypothetical protein [Alkalihalobacillus deserti]|uniref:hypothetical protein n=1 Tax=Alkalihalobacillus deserti TaxID=2879466 RepID=UPI001D13B564|nr:hypothetical protein [Alkalihalobacillus deserti]
MNKKEMEQKVIANFQQDEQMMILVFAQWCINHDIDPVELYTTAYPHQVKNGALQYALDLTVPKHESESIADETLLGVLALFGNDDLAFVVTEEMKKRKNQS